MKKIILAKVGESDLAKEQKLNAYVNQIENDIKTHINTYVKEKIGGNENGD